ncbi:MAG: FGGY family carbohydrate kinase [Deltaproteobacteria bacterium]|jgi:xylulokinase
MPTNLYLGLDLSTQSLTAVVIDPLNKTLQKHAINFDSSYPDYQTSGGVISGDAPGEVHADPQMWLEALDDMLAWLKQKKLAPKISGIGVSAQQHGSVYLNQDAAAAFSNLDPSLSLPAQSRKIFARPTCPVWMDSSTHNQCWEITAALGGDGKVAALTGSAATERFAGPQIRKFWQQHPGDYKKTAHITLISAFISAFLIGRTAPLDAGDGYGMNLADIHSGTWSPAAMAATAPGLEKRLPELLTRDTVLDKVSHYLVEKYGFRPDTEVIVGSGDNPCSLVGLGLIGQADIHAISLGTSDTYFGYLPQLTDQKRSTGHVFGTADGNAMFLICFKNGSLAREQIKNRFGLSWDEFSEILLRTGAGNQGRIMLPYFLPEITPLVLKPTVARFGGLTADDAAASVRAVAEAQVMAMYLHSGWTGGRPQRILVTAGGSQNRGLLNVIAQVFGTEVHSFEIQESAALGAALRAASCCQAAEGNPISWQELAEPFLKQDSAQVACPDQKQVKIYQGKNGLLDVYQTCEAFVLNQGPDPHQKIEVFQSQFCKNL